MENAVSWFEIPVKDLARAVRFYEALLDTTLRREKVFGSDVAVFPAKGVAGALTPARHRRPTADGICIYLHIGQGSGALDVALERARDAGGTVLAPVTQIGANGWFAVLRDTEGNAVGLHAPR